MQNSFSQKAAVLTDTPCMKVLSLFKQPDVPAMSADEVFAPMIAEQEAEPDNLPGNGLSQHPMLYIGENCNRIFVVEDGKVIWTYSTGTGPEYDDVWMLSNGNILFTRMQYIAEVTPDKKVVWRYDCDTTSGDRYAEVHTCQPIGLDRVMFVENSMKPTLKIVNIKTGKVEVEHPIPYDNVKPTEVHAQFRRVRVTNKGTYLVSYLQRDKVVEYDKDFKEIWSYPVSSPWAAIRLQNGNTLITSEKEWITREIDPAHKIVWEFNAKTDIPSAYQLYTAPQSCTRLSNGNTIFTSRGKPGAGPQLIEVTADKKIAWVLEDWKHLGGASAVQILDDPGYPEVPGDSQH